MGDGEKEKGLCRLLCSKEEAARKFADYVRNVILPQRKACAERGHPNAYVDILGVAKMARGDYSGRYMYCPDCRMHIKRGISSKDRDEMEKERLQRLNTPMTI